MEKILADLQPQDHSFADAIKAGCHRVDIAMLLQSAMLPPATAALRPHRPADMDSEAMIWRARDMRAARRNAHQIGLQTVPAASPCSLQGLSRSLPADDRSSLRSIRA